MGATVAQAKYQCKNGCGYENEHRGGMNLHERLHCPKVRQDTCEAGGQCEWRPLNLRDPQEKAEVFNGYKEVCKKCLEMKK
jgi:hypothetical protein